MHVHRRFIPVCVFLLAALPLVAPAQTGGAVRIASGAPEGAYHRIAGALNTAVERDSDYTVEVLMTSGSLDNIERLKNGRAEFGLIQGALTAGEGREGLLDNLRGVATVCREYAHVIVAEDSPVQSVTDLAGKRVGLGPERGGARALGSLLLQFCAFEPPPTPVHEPWDTIRADLDSGRVDAAFLVFGLYAEFMQRLLADGRYRLIPVPQAEAMARYVPEVHEGRIPGHSYGPNRSQPADGALTTIAVDTLLVCRADAPEALVRTMTEALYTPDVISSARLTGLTEAEGRRVVELPLHAAADTFYRRNDPISADRFEIASFFLAGVIAAASAFHYLVGYYRQKVIERKRHAIMPYFESMLEYGEAVEKTGEIEQLVDLIHSMMASQRRAEKDWLAGKLDTEHMENLYSVYNIRSRNAFSKILQIQNIGIQEKLVHMAPLLAAMAEKNGVEVSRSFMDMVERYEKSIALLTSGGGSTAQERSDA